MPKKTSKTRSEARDRGQLVPKGDRKWLLRVFQGRVPDGKGGMKRKYASKVFEGTKTEAEKALTSFLSEIDGDEYVEPTKVTVSSFWPTFMATVVDVASNTRNDHDIRFRLDIMPALGHLKLTELDHEVLQAFFNELSFGDRKLSPRTVRMTFTALRKMLILARTKRLIGRNPLDGVKLPKYLRKEMKVLTPEQMGAFLRASSSWRNQKYPNHPGSRYHALWCLLLTTGLRPCEALALKWSDIRDGTVTVRRSVVLRRDNSEFEIKPAGSNKIKPRRIDLMDSTVTALLRHEVRQKEEMLQAGSAYERNDWVFANATGGLLYLGNVRMAWKKDLKRAKLPVVRLYDSRHSHLTMALAAGENPKVVAERGGHSVEMLMSTYAAVLPGMQRDMAKRLDTVLKLA